MDRRDPPLSREEYERLEPQLPTEPEPAQERVLATAFISGPDAEDPSAIRTRTERVENADGTSGLQVELVTDLPEEATRPPVLAVRRERPSGELPDEIEGHTPPWVGTQPVPERVEPPPRPSVRRGDEELDPLTIFPPDSRTVYSAANHPWGLVCQIFTDGYWGSGVLIGPRHVLTASHLINWGGFGYAFVRVHPFAGIDRGRSFATTAWAYTQVGEASWTTVDEDYAILVLGKRLGDQLGYLGARTYDSSWDGEPYWHTMGYAGDIAGGQRPVFQSYFRLDEDDFDYGSARAMTSEDGDFMKRQSGSPVFAYWNGKGWRVVGVVSAEGENGGPNYIAGGSLLVDLIKVARMVWP